MTPSPHFLLVLLSFQCFTLMDTFIFVLLDEFFLMLKHNDHWTIMLEHNCRTCQQYEYSLYEYFRLSIAKKMGRKGRRTIVSRDELNKIENALCRQEANLYLLQRSASIIFFREFHWYQFLLNFGADRNYSSISMGRLTSTKTSKLAWN